MAAAATKTCDVLRIPFKNDCEELLGRFQQVESVRYEEFAAIWRAMDFSSVFYGMITNYEKRPFTRLVFTTVYDYFLPPYSFQIRVGALYMFYGLYFTQLVWPKEKIWIALKDWMCVQNFLSDALTCQHLDVVYVYRKLVYEKAFFYTAMPIQLTFDGKRRYKSKKINELFQDQRSRVMELVNAGTVEEITNVHAHYERIKEALQVSTSVSVTPVNLSVQLQQCALEFQQWKENTKNSRNKSTGKKEKESTPHLENSKRADQLASIKSKSYGHLATASKSRRHRQVEMDNSGSGTDHTQESLSPHKQKQLSLRQRTWQNLGKKESEEQKQQHWLLSTKEEDKAAMKRCPQKKRFKW
ncbi:snRNA-activating protein complex subunit 1a isoform X2 [Silurus meridionalis]|uniref:snRNA-activating protein complex subunit 1a isoform X2 n=1 Tax=Silurus meridionalis TaxID=175797 RepID=UPI001EEA1B10|nr:snRNA-activating protein complex subunit 1a isoform X2 [Silurus meridionalis]